MKLKEISYSKLRRYLFCPRSFRFSYIDRVEPLSQGLLRVGGAIHKATELLIKEGREIGEVAGIKGIYSLLSDPVEIGDALLMFKRVSRMLENHSYLRPELPLRSRIKNLPRLSAGLISSSLPEISTELLRLKALTGFRQNKNLRVTFRPGSTR